MHRRRLTVALAAAALAACAPSIDKRSNAASTDFVVFDPATSQIPLPNDLALQTAATTPGANGELLRAFAAQGGFPNDQEVPITIDVQRFTYGGSTPQQGKPPSPVDKNTLVVFNPKAPGPSTIAIFEKKAGATAAAPVDPATVEVSYVEQADRGTVTIQNKLHAVTLSPGDVIQSRRWNAGSQYVVLLKGAASGVKLQGGGELTAMPTIYFLTRGIPLTDPADQYLLPGDGRQGRAATGAQLEAIRQSYLKAGLIGTGSAAEQVFGAGATQDLLSIQTFQVAPAAKAGDPSTFVVTDASAGVVPLPSDLLLDPATGGKTIVNNPAFGGLAAGIATLDGFSTTAMELSQTTAPIVAATVSASTVFLYDLSNPAAPVRLKEVKEGPTTAGFVAEPFQMTQKLVNGVPTPCSATDAADPNTVCASPAIGLQPAVPVPLNPTGTLFAALPPLKEGTEYAVLITDGVKDTAGKPLQRSTLSRILLFDNALVDATGKSQLTGQPDATAGGLEKIRQGVGAAAAALLAEKGTTKDHIVLGYTFRTQSITQTSLQLAAAPYQQAATFVPQGVPIDLTALGAVPVLTAVKAVWSVTVPTLNPIDITTGALNPDNTKWSAATLNALVVVPGTPKQGAPLVVFQHGLGRNKGDVLAIASALAGAGFVTASIDAPLHGDRAYCAADTDCTCSPIAPSCTAKCGFFGPAGLQGETVQIGQCTSGSVAVSSGGTNNSGVSGKFFVSQNLFRTRDALRQDILDTSALVLALAPTSAPSNPFATQLAAAGVTIDPTKVYWIGQSLGGILGTLNTAANPRISKAVLNVPGGTLADVFTQSAAFTPVLTPLLASIPPPLGPIVVGTPQYLQFIQVAKLVLDGGDPVNFARHLTGDATHPTLPDLIASKPIQTAKSVLGQVAIGDTTIPNPFNFELLGNVFASPLPAASAPNNVVTYAGAGVSHGFLLNFPPTASSTTAQADAASFLATGAIPANPNQAFP